MQGFERWCQQHANKFGLQTPADRDMLLAWEPIFDRAGFTLPELMKASETMGLNPPEFRSKHLGIILDVVKTARLKANRQIEEMRREETDRCPNCRGTGLVPVPNPKCVKDGKWEPRIGGNGLIWYEAVVTCGCTVGAEKAKQMVGTTMTLEQYEKYCPTWREQMAEKKAEKFRERAARGKAEDLDKTMGPLFQKVVDKAKKKERP